MSKPLESFITSLASKKRDDSRKNENNSKKHLYKNLETKLKTTFIGAIDSFEKRFGYLWGKDKDPKDRNKTEQDMYSLWMEVRHEILNKGNTQIRAVAKDLDNYTVIFNMYKTIFKVIGEDKNE